VKKNYVKLTRYTILHKCYWQ